MDIAIGVDAHKDELAVASIDPLGRVVAQERFANEPSGHAALAAWVARHQPPRRVGIEGAGNYAWQLTLVLQRAGEDVREVPGRLTQRARRHQRRAGKSDPTDAIAIAGVVMREPELPPAPAAGPTRDLKMLVNYRDGLAVERTRLTNRLHADLRALHPGYGRGLAHLASGGELDAARRLLRGDHSVHADLARRRLARLRALDRELADLERQLRQQLHALGRALPAICGVGPIVAARVRGEVGDIHRFTSAPAFAMACGVAPIPASSGQVTRHRLNRGGNRRLNAALHTVALVQARREPRAKDYLARKRAAGKSWREALRCLKRHLADVIYRALLLDAQKTEALTI